MSHLRGSLYTTPAMAAVFAPEAQVQQMLAFEAALARAQAHAGIIPAAAAVAIEAGCHAENFDIEAIHQEALLAGTVAIPLVRMLAEQVAPAGRGYVHWGATSQDAIDTATVLQMRDGLALIDADLNQLCAACASLAQRHRHTLMAGRTLLQQALPITFGLKAARWLSLAVRQRQALGQQRDQSLALQFGGAAGTLAALGTKGLQVAQLLAAELGLPLPELPWHAERDRVAAIAAGLGVAAGAMAKIAQDLVLLAQTEVAEVAEAAEAGKGGSSAMPHKHNPVDAILALAAARLAIGQVPVVLVAMGQEHERAAGGWQAEWSAIPDLFCTTAGAVARVGSAVAGLRIDAERMRANLDAGGGLIMAEAVAMALAAQVGRPQAQQIVGGAVALAAAGNTTFRQALLDNTQVRDILSPDEIDGALDPAAYLGSADAMIDRALESYRAA